MKQEAYLLAQVVIITSAFAFTEQDGHHLSHVDAQESVWIPDHGRQNNKCNGFCHCVVCQILSTKCRDLHVELDHERAIKSLSDRKLSLIRRGKNQSNLLPTPKIPRITKNMISKECQLRLYVTWKRTSFPVRKGFMIYRLCMRMHREV